MTTAVGMATIMAGTATVDTGIMMNMGTDTANTGTGTTRIRASGAQSKRGGFETRPSRYPGSVNL